MKWFAAKYPELRRRSPISDWLIAFAALLAPVHAVADTGVVVTADGQVGGVAADGILSFKGIPYAAPPVGELRFRPPQPPSPWDGVRASTEFGPSCMQTGRFTGVNNQQSEDCLTLNIWKPDGERGHLLPVMVWLHGGAFLGGSSVAPFYDGASFARNGVIFVSLNYRLGRLGFFAHPSLLEEDGLHGNYGLMDQIAALEWVKGNIEQFGGDPKNVTLFGESAGGMSVNLLMASTLARGLFDKAITQSGFGRMPYPSIEQASASGKALADTADIPESDPDAAQKLRSLPAEFFLTPPSVLGGPDMPGPMVDGELLTSRVDQVFAAGAQASVPFLLGGNSNDASLLGGAATQMGERIIQLFGDDENAVRKFDPRGDRAFASTVAATDALMTEPDRFLALAHSRNGAPTFLYYFDYVPTALRPQTRGAAHGSDIGFVFNTLDAAPLSFNATEPRPSEPDQALAHRMHRYWVNFAKFGNPGTVDGVAWPSFDDNNRARLVFTNEGTSVRKGFLDERLDAIAPN